MEKLHIYKFEKENLMKYIYSNKKVSYCILIGFQELLV